MCAALLDNRTGSDTSLSVGVVSSSVGGATGAIAPGNGRAGFREATPNSLAELVASREPVCRVSVGSWGEV